MISALKPYPAMKDSGFEWLGEVPVHWEVKQLRMSVDGCINGIWGNDPDGHYDLVCIRVADFDRVKLRVNLKHKTVRSIALGERKRRLLKKNDLLIEKSGGGDLQPVGAVVMYDYDLPAVCSNFVARMPVSSRFNASYLTYLHFYLYSKRLNMRSIKQTTGIQNLDSRSYLSERVVFPPLTEQTAVVRFLDHADRGIRRYIRAKQKLNALLEEQKQAIIHQAVTGRIDVRTGLPYHAYKPSGVEWLREVPEHWGEISLWAAADLVQTGPFGSQLHASDYVNGGIPVINPSHMRNSSIEPDPSISISQEKAEELSRHELKPGDIVMARRGEMGRCALVTEIEAGWLCGTGSLQIRTKSGKFAPAYLLLVLNSPRVRDTLSLESIGATMDNLNAGMVSRLVLPDLPFPEQIAIVGFVDKWRNNIDNAIDCSRRQINLLREYRTRLIADVVTGKLDVREAAAVLPEVDPLAADGELDESIDSDTEANSDGLEAIPEEVEA